MRVASRIFRVLMWLALVVYTTLQLLAAYGITVNNNQPVLEKGMPEKVFSVVPLLAATALMVAAVIIFTAWKKRPAVGLVVGGAAAVVVLVATLSLGRAFPVITNSYGEYGLSFSRLALCHYGFISVPLLMLLTFLSGRAADNRALVRNAARDGRRWKQGRESDGSKSILHDPELTEATRQRKKWWTKKKK